MSKEIDPYVEALVTQLIKDNLADNKLDFPLVIPDDYKQKVFDQRELVKELIVSKGYQYTESGLPEDWANGWELGNSRSTPQDPIPDDMLFNNKVHHLYKRGSDTAKNYRIWVMIPIEM